MAGYATNPLEDPEILKKYDVMPIDITGLAVEALKDSPLTHEARSCAPRISSRSDSPTGSMAGRSNRPSNTSTPSGPKLPDVADANIRVLKAGYFLGETTETTRNRYMVSRAEVEPGTYRKISGNDAIALGLIAGAKKAGRELLFSGYPITPASSILEALAGFKHFGIKTVQAEDEIAAIGVALGASFAGQIGVTGTSGPGMCLKSEFIGLAISTELPLVIVNVQRGGPSTGLPTKTEQSDLLQALYGRHGESPLPVVAANSPSDCFRAAFEAVRIALNIRRRSSCSAMAIWPMAPSHGKSRTKPPCRRSANPSPIPRNPTSPSPATRKPSPAPRPSPASPDSNTGSADSKKTKRRHQLRFGQPQRNDPPARRQGRGRRQNHPAAQHHRRKSGKLLVLGWGGTHGAITSAVDALRAEGFDVSSTNLRYLNPLPPISGTAQGF
jgi:2-oxoglutarate/2-oxoacid ferredoxin oxidoreductase subunit alpha